MWPTDKVLHCAVVCSVAANPLGPTPDVVPPAQAYQKIVDLGTGKAKLDVWKTFLFGLLAGAYVGMGALLALTVGGACPGILQANPGLQKIVLGTFGLPFGLMMVLNCGAELFTGNTAMVTAAVYEGKATWGQLAKNWVFSYLGNLLGSIGLVYLLVQAGTVGNPTALSVAAAKTSLTFGQAFLRGILANWLVCLAIWMATASSSLPGKIIGVWLPISAFVAMGFEHSVANMFFIPFGMASGSSITTAQFLTANLIPVTLGNIVGGAFCVATIYSALYGRLGNGGKD
ncbi:unnamed protein product [Ostreobium quekettii]|uniref:Formate/nitrite transporter n=1 Tax=Ostreobium quekettii TaxID=121088 RepID=A0A8S1JDW5_9CHLO|nr:unnamed protein product [Ostreobium quekettii]|eukprot:evm.model.scf_536.5 EVM.evm.TU.scf_536.5   scf_536:71900-74861(-)